MNDTVTSFEPKFLDKQINCITLGSERLKVSKQLMPILPNDNPIALTYLLLSNFFLFQYLHILIHGRMHKGILIYKYIILTNREEE